MSEFKDMVREDVENVFLDLDFFGETHVIAGKEMTAIFDDVEKEKRSGRKDDISSVHKKTVLFYVSSEEFGALPAVGRVLSIDGKEYRVTKAEDECGVYAVTAEANRQ